MARLVDQSSSISAETARLELGVLRNALRNEINRALVLQQPGRFLGLVSSRARASTAAQITEEQVAKRVKALNTETGFVAADLQQMIRGHISGPSSGDAPDFMGGSDRGSICTKCDASVDGRSGDCRVHTLPAEVLMAAGQDPIRAFGLSHTVVRELGETCSSCGGALQGLGWFSASAVAADAPRLVALWWDVNQEVNAAEHSDFVEAADSSIVLDASARDDAVLATPHGQVTLELVSLCYFSGNHYIPSQSAATHASLRHGCAGMH